MDFVMLCVDNVDHLLAYLYEAIEPYRGDEFGTHGPEFLRAFVIAMLGVYLQRFIMSVSGDLVSADPVRVQKRKAVDLVLAALSLDFAFVIVRVTESAFPSWFLPEGDALPADLPDPTFVLFSFTVATLALWVNVVVPTHPASSALNEDSRATIVRRVFSVARHSRTGLARFSLLFAAWL